MKIIFAFWKCNAPTNIVFTGRDNHIFDDVTSGYSVDTV